MKNKLTAEQWAARKAITAEFHIAERGIAHKSKSPASGKKLQVLRHPRHIAHRKVKRDGTTQHERVVLGRK